MALPSVLWHVFFWPGRAASRAATKPVQEALGFEVFVYLRRGEGGIPSEVAAQVPFPVALNDRFQNVAPAVGAVNVAGA